MNIGLLQTNDLLMLSARALMAAPMIRYGLLKLLNISIFVENFATRRFMEFFAHGIEAPLWFAYSNAIFQTCAGIFVLIGFKGRTAAILLVGWLVTLTYFAHPFWSMSGGERIFNESYFYRNLAMIAAFLMMFLFGPGTLSVDELMRLKKDPRAKSQI